MIPSKQKAVQKPKRPVTFLKRETIILTKDLKTKVDVKLKEMIALSKKLWKHEHLMPEVRYDLKTLTCGMAIPAWNRLRLHPIFLVENELDYLTETVPHEFAHLLVPHIGPQLRTAWLKTGRITKEGMNKKFMSHGPEWQAIMVALGRGPKKGQPWKEVIKHSYNPSSIDMPVRKKHGPRKAGGKKVGEILLRIKGLKPEELEALKQRLGFEIKEMEEQRPPTPQEIQAGKEAHDLASLLRSDFTHLRPHGMASYAGWATHVITNLNT